MTRIEINDLNVDLEELKKQDPSIMKKIRGGRFAGVVAPTYVCTTMPSPRGVHIPTGYHCYYGGR